MREGRKEMEVGGGGGEEGEACAYTFVDFFSQLIFLVKRLLSFFIFWVRDGEGRGMGGVM